MDKRPCTKGPYLILEKMRIAKAKTKRGGRNAIKPQTSGCLNSTALASFAFKHSLVFTIRFIFTLLSYNLYATSTVLSTYPSINFEVSHKKNTNFENIVSRYFPCHLFIICCRTYCYNFMP